MDSWQPIQPCYWTHASTDLLSPVGELCQKLPPCAERQARGPDASLKDVAKLPDGFFCMFVVRVTGLSYNLSEHIHSLFRNVDLQSLVLCITFAKKSSNYCRLQTECVAQTTCDLPPMITSVIGINSKVASCHCGNGIMGRCLFRRRIPMSGAHRHRRQKSESESDVGLCFDEISGVGTRSGLRARRLR